MQHILLHPGLHRTGTSSMQHFLWRNREELVPYTQVMLTRHMKPVAQKCFDYAISQNPLGLLDMSALLDETFDDFNLPTGQNLLISSEMLSGAAPGQANCFDYSAAPVLIEYLVGYLQERFPDTRLRVLLSTREHKRWLRSLYYYQLRMTRLTSGEEDFMTQYSAMPDHDAVALEIATLLAPLEVLTLDLDDASAYAFGPGGALVQAMNVPEDVIKTLAPVGRGNTAPSFAMREQFLTLNRSDKDDQSVARQKAMIAKEVDLGAWVNV
jgi:hypothetical protein